MHTNDVLHSKNYHFHRLFIGPTNHPIIIELRKIGNWKSKRTRTLKMDDTYYERPNMLDITFEQLANDIEIKIPNFEKHIANRITKVIIHL